MAWGPWSPTTRTRVPTYGKASGGIRITRRPPCGGETSTCCSPAWRCKVLVPRPVAVRGRSPLRCSGRLASERGSVHCVGLAGTGVGRGVAAGLCEWLACLILLLLGWLFVPYSLKSGVYPIPAVGEKRCASASRTYFTWVSVIGYVLT